MFVNAAWFWRGLINGRARELWTFMSLSNTGAAAAQSCHGNGAGPLRLVSRKLPLSLLRMYYPLQAPSSRLCLINVQEVKHFARTFLLCWSRGDFGEFVWRKKKLPLYSRLTNNACNARYWHLYRVKYYFFSPCNALHYRVTAKSNALQ